jgi:glycosyltransferase involved in cell wall biosynthesis
MEEHPKFSICIAAYEGTFLNDAIESALSQGCDSLEIIVGDDSGGALRNLVESYKDCKVKYLPNPANLGYARNTCNLIATSTGQYISLLQHDDVMERGFLERAAGVLDQDRSIGVLIGGSNDIDAKGTLIAQRPTSMSEGVIPDPLGELLSSDAMIFLPSATIVRRTAVELHMSPWPNNAVADYSMYIELAQAEWKFYYLPEAKIGYRIHADQLSSKRISHRSSIIDIWSSFHFQGAEHERKRIDLLAKAFCARAGGLARLKKGLEARQDLERARNLMPSAAGGKWKVIWVMTYLPWLVPAAISFWERLRDPHKNRYKGF